MVHIWEWAELVLTIEIQRANKSNELFQYNLQPTGVGHPILPAGWKMMNAETTLLKTGSIKRLCWDFSAQLFAKYMLAIEFKAILQ